MSILSLFLGLFYQDFCDGLMSQTVLYLHLWKVWWMESHKMMSDNDSVKAYTELRQRHEILRNEVWASVAGMYNMYFRWFVFYWLLWLQYQAVKRKLDSKNDALLILSRELVACQKERDELKLMADQLRSKYQSLKAQVQNGQVRLSMPAPSYAYAAYSFTSSSNNLRFEICWYSFCSVKEQANWLEIQSKPVWREFCEGVGLTFELSKQTPGCCINMKEDDWFDVRRHLVHYWILTTLILIVGLTSVW